jgi:two-component system sensor histidine kinase/response regulator
VNDRAATPTGAPNPTVLIVDDAPANVELIEGFLENLNYRLTRAANGTEALRAIRDDPPDVILLDIMMPDIDGFEVCSQIKSSEQTRSIPVIMLTALNEIDDYVRAIDCGADDFISKPCNPAILRARIRGYVRQKQLVDRLDRAQEFREDFVRMLAHDLNNHMGAVLGYVELLTTRPDLSEKARMLAHKAMRSLDEGVRLLNNFTGIEKFEANRMTVAVQPVDLIPIVRRAIELRELLWKSRALEIGFESPDSLTAFVDPDLIARVIANLLDNAAKYAPDHSPVHLRCSTCPNKILFSVANHGPIISAEDQHNMFEKFHQLEARPQSSPRGCGLGLAFSRMAMQAQGGMIGVTSPAPGWDDGVCFEVVLRATPPAGQEGTTDSKHGATSTYLSYQIPPKLRGPLASPQMSQD